MLLVALGRRGANVEEWGTKSLTPTPNSYANDPAAELGVWYIHLKPGGRVTVPAATGGNVINRRAYFIEGSMLSIGEQSIEPSSQITLVAGKDAEFVNKHSIATAALLILQGKPIGEPVAQHGPFVMNTNSEIQQAFADYQHTQFGGWPWPEDAMVFPREQTRFAQVDGKKIYPPNSSIL
jgi:redox-sensitive bicupin YhaK (pirin superfamily)